MTMIVLRLLSLLGLKSQWHRHFSPRRLNNKVFFRGGISVDSWTLGPKPLCHRHPTGPHPSGLLWTPWTPAKGDSTKSNFALVDQANLHVGARRIFDRRQAAAAGHARRDLGAGLGGQPLVPVVPPRARILGGAGAP